MADEEGETSGDVRMEALQNYTLKTMKLKNDKWAKMMSQEDNLVIFNEFLERGDRRILVVYLNSTGQLVPMDTFPTTAKNKAVYFIKRAAEPIKKENVKTLLMFGDVSHIPLDQLSYLVESILIPLISNSSNNDTWPQVVSDDVSRHMGTLKGEVFVLSGQVKGRTLLPLPAQADLIIEAAECEAEGRPYDKGLIHAMETVVIEWSHQIQAVLKKSSAQLLLDGQNPGPLVEVDFWKARVGDLESVMDQLITDKAQKMSAILEKTQSAYYPALQSMMKDAKTALEEAADIYIHLKPMRKHFEDLEESDFVDVGRLLSPMFHCLCLVWVHSKHYQQSSRIVVLLQEITNLMLEMMRNYVSEEILRMEPDEGLEKIKETVEMCHKYIDHYHDHRKNLQRYFKDSPVVPWTFHSSLIFSRLDFFLQQLKVIEEYFHIVNSFLKLEKIEFGGLRGLHLGEMVLDMFNQFQDLMTAFAGKAHNPVSPDNQDFAKEYVNFKSTINDMDMRLGLIAYQAFDECSNCESAFKLIDMMGTLLQRPVIDNNFKCKYPLLVKMVDQELDAIKKVYDSQLALAQTPDGPHVHKNMPKVAGVLRWSQELRERTSLAVEKLKAIEHGISQDSPEFVNVLSKYGEMTKFIDSFEGRVFQEWTEGVDAIAKSNLDKPLLVWETRDGMDLISVNFDPQLVALLREVKYLNQRDSCDDQPIPQSAASVFSSDETYRKFLQNLDVTVTLYNNVKETIMDVEEPLIEEELASINTQLQKAMTDMNWTSEGAWEYIQATRDLVRDLEKRVRQAKMNVDTMTDIMSKWSQKPLYQRKEDKKDSLLNIEDKETIRQTRYNLVKEGADKIMSLVQENLEYFKAVQDSDEWRRYIEYLDDIILDGLFNCIHCSLQYLSDNTTSTKESMLPLFDVKLELQSPDTIFNPSLDQDSPDGFTALVEGLIDDIFKVASLVPRVAKHKDLTDYTTDVEELAELLDLKEEILSRVSSALDKAIEFRNSFESYSYLWVDDRQEFMEQFLVYGHVLTTEEIEQAGDEGVPESPPTLEMFKKQVDSYEKIHSEVEKFKDTVQFDVWFRVDSRPFKNALRNIVKRWSLMFKQHLIDHVTNSVHDLNTFIKKAKTGLSITVEEGDYDSLVSVMNNLLGVRDRQAATDTMFEPLKQTIELLKTYDQEMSDEIHTLLEELPEKWNTLKKTLVAVKQTVAPLQANEVNLLRRKLASFDVSQHEFRERFRKTAPFAYAADVVYARIDRANRQIADMEKEMTSLKEAANLFEVNVPDFKQLKTCRREIALLKVLWDMVILVRSTFEDWNSTLWKDINVEQMDIDCKKFVKDIRTLDKEMRAWNVFAGMDSTVKNMVTSLRAVGELQNQAIRDRHWDQLMQATQVKFVMSDDTNLADLLALNLHNFEDEVRNIVDKATKELTMEKTLKELNKTWSEMEFEHEHHKRTGLELLKTTEELVETLEENQVQLQNMMTSKFVGYFHEQVSSWQKKLSNADSVISIWMEVQRTWSHLESIFIGSEDIRAQLPEHSKEFDQIDSDFKRLVNEAEKTPNVVQATNRTGLYDELEKIQERLVNSIRTGNTCTVINCLYEEMQSWMIKVITTNTVLQCFKVHG